MNPTIYKKYCLIAFLFFAWMANAQSQGYLKAGGKKIINEKGDAVLLRGMGLGGWMLQEGYMLGINAEGQQYRIRQRIEELIGVKSTEEFYDVWLSHFIQKADIDSLKAWGFNSVRVPLHYNLFTLPVDKEPVKGQNTWLDKGFQLTDSLLSWCKANRMYLILDMHAAPGGQGNDLNISDRDPSRPSLWEDDANKHKMIALWRRLAAHYREEPWIGGYDIINEPNWGFADPLTDKNGLKEKGNEPLRKLMMDITTAIREVDKKHLIIIEGNGWGNNYNGIFPLWDDNLVLSYHKYWNKNDAASIQHILDTRDKLNVPVWLGETGENSNVWFTQAIRLLEANDIGWAWWPLKKLGFNNPLQIRSNLNYQDVVNYWNGNGKKPGESNAYSGLLELATYTSIKTNSFHKDVVDAMMRQPFTDVVKPFKANIINGTGSLNAVDYDLGKNGFAYLDNDTADYRVSGQSGVGNRGRIYRNDGVDIRKDSSTYESYYVSDIEKGEWLQYTLDVRKEGSYLVSIVAAPQQGEGKLAVSIDAEAKTSPVDVSAKAEKGWQVIPLQTIRFTKGSHTLRLHIEQGGFYLKALQFAIK